MDELFILLVIGVVVGVTIYSYLKRRERLSTLASELGLSLEGFGMGTVRISGDIEKVPTVFEFGPKSKNSPARMTVTVSMSQPYTFRLTPQHMLTGLKVNFGFGRDLQVGHRELDDAFEIDAGEDKELKWALRSAHVRQELLNLAIPELQSVAVSPQSISYTRAVDEGSLAAVTLRHTAEHLRHLSTNLADAPRPSSSAVDLTPAVDPDLPPPRPKPTAGPVPDHQPPATVHQPPAPVPPTPAPPAQQPSPEARTPGQGTATDPQALLDQIKQSSITPEQAAKQAIAGGDEWIEQLVLALADYRIRDAVKQALIATSSKAVPMLVQQLKNYRIADQVREVLKQLDADAARTLLELTPTIDDSRVLERLIEALGELNPDGTLECCKTFVRHQDFGVASRAQNALRKRGMSYEQIRKIKAG